MVNAEIDPRVLNNLQSMLIDLISGDESVLTRQEYRTINPNTINTALKFLLENPLLDDKQKAYLATNSWRINYRDRPPSVSEFITEKYLGRAATHTYDRVRKVFEEFMNPNTPYRNLVLYPAIGWGKASRLTARVYTPDGYKYMKDIAIGDEVSTPNGKTAKVIQTFDQPSSLLYKVTFSDGRSTVVHADHLWKIARRQNEDGVCWEILSTKEILEQGNIEDHQWFIPLTEPALHTKRLHTIPPYILGVMLGCDVVVNSSTIYLRGGNKDIFNKIKAALPKDLLLQHTKDHTVAIQPKNPNSKNIYKDELQRLKILINKKKAIPKEYLYDAVENRIALIQGLMDTSGTLNIEDYDISFSSTSQKLAKDTLQLAQSLGGYGRLQNSVTGKQVGISHHMYSVAISFPNRTLPVFSLKQKQNRYINSITRSKSNLTGNWLFLASIEPFAEEPSKCILLDDTEHLYLTDEYIVTHNSYLSMLINIYIGVHLSLMRNPYKFFGLNPSSILSQLLISYSLKKSSELLLEPMIAILEASPFFEKVHTRDGMIKRDQDFERQSKIDKIYWTTAVPTSAIQFSNGANFKLASSAHSLLGLTVVTGTMSELSFFRDAGKSDEYILRIFNDLKSRIDSRMKGNYFGRSILDSSPNTLESPIDDYIVNHARKDPTNYIVSGSAWEWKIDDYDTSNTFKVFVGGKGQPPRIIDDDEDISVINPVKIIDVPLQLKQFFIDDIYKALKDRAGIPAGSADNLIYDYSKIEKIFNVKLRNVYSHITASSEEPPAKLIWNQVSHLFFKQKAGKLEFWYKPWLPRCVSVDQSISQDVSCIACAHVERIRDTDDQMYVVDFTIPIAPMGARINLDAIRMFIQELRDLGGMVISNVSFDQFQSEASIQYLKSQGFEVEKLSVDLTTDPYFYLLNLIETGRIIMGRNLHVKNNLKSLKIVKPNTKTGRIKVDHEDSRPTIINGSLDWDKSMIGFFAKDSTDAIAGAVELLRRYHPIAYDFWDEAALDSYITESAEKKNAEKKLACFMANNGMHISAPC